jgi:hypothetical protein
MKLLIDPDLPADFDQTPNEERSDDQLDAFWRKPFALTLPDGTYEVRCLDGGAWDRSTWYGQAATLETAQEIADTKLAKWVKMASTPVMTIFDDNAVALVIYGQRPGDEPVEVFRGSQQECQAELQRLQS